MHGCGGCAWLRESGVAVGGACVVAGGMCGCGVCVWLRGVCMVVGGMHGCRRGHTWLEGACVVAVGACVVAGGHAWLWGVCVVVGGMHGGRGDMGWIRRNTVNERAVGILLECILVFLISKNLMKLKKS